MKRTVSAFLLGLAMAVSTALVAAPANAQLQVRVTDGNYEPLPIAIPEFASTDARSAALAREISEVVRADLVSSGLFKMTDPASFIQRDLDVTVQPRFADWKIIKTDALVVGSVSIGANGQAQVAYRLWDVPGEDVMRLTDDQGRPQAGLIVTHPSNNPRRIAHKIADKIYSRLTGEDGYFDTRIVYVAESGDPTARVKRLAIMYRDGAEQRFLTPGRNQVLTPRFSPTEQKITYMSFESGRPQVYLFDLQTGRQETLGSFKGMTFAPRFTPDGRSVLYSQADGGNTDVYVMDLNTRRARRLTDHPAIDTSPSMSPDGSAIVFNSDRGGSPQLYIMNTDGSPRTCPSGGRDTACRISFGPGQYSTPVWSPRGDLIAFTKQRGKFFIGVIGIDGKGERLLSEAYLDEGPTWSPNGRVIAFFRETRPGSGPKLWSVDLTGRNERQIQTTTDASDPAWSPLLE